MRLPQSFFRRDVVTVARELLGREIRAGEVRLRISEVEAYGHDDSASHARAGKTPRTAVMFGPPGRTYVYLCYGIHQMLNFSTGEVGEGAAVLVRACEVVGGETIVAARRGGRTGPESLSGPGKVGAALALDSSFNDLRVYAPGPIELHAGAPPASIACGPRVGIDFASPDDREARWRFGIAGSRWVSHRGSLAPL